MKRFFVRSSLILSAGFTILFLLRLGYGYLSHPSTVGANISNGWAYSNQAENVLNNSANNIISSERKNYASAKAKPGSAAAPDQKYEKVGTVVAQSQNFSEDEKNLRALIVQYKALIQSEQRFGLPGGQSLQLGIGVIPDKFDDMVRDCRAIGKTLSLQINKTDKTNEYKDLQAKKTSLVQTREALASLKSRSGKIEELMELENRILEIEEQIQGLGVRLGEYDAENEFCTVKLILSESEKPSGIPFIQRIKVAFEWTVSVYAGLMFIAFFGALSLALLTWALPASPLSPNSLNYFEKLSAVCGEKAEHPQPTVILPCPPSVPS